MKTHFGYEGIKEKKIPSTLEEEKKCTLSSDKSW